MGILEFLTALFQLVPKLIDLWDRIGKQIDKAQLDAWIDKVEDAVSLNEKAANDEDRVKAARAWVDVLRTMRRKSN